MAAAKESQGVGPAADPAQEFLEFWRNYFEQTAIQTRVLLESMQGGKMSEQMHNQWLASLSASLDGFMRTPAFLEALKQTLTRMVDLKRLQDQATQSLAQQSGFPLSGDVAGVVDRLRSTELAILTRLAALEERLGAIETSLSSAPASPHDRPANAGS